MLKKLIKHLGLVLFIVLSIGSMTATGYLLWLNRDYYDELTEIQQKLNEVEGAKVLNIWGHDAETLEEISARIQIKDKGTIVLKNLSKDQFSYPNKVLVLEFGGKFFKYYACCDSISVGSSLDLGTNSFLAKKINKTFLSPKAVIENFDYLKPIIDSIPIFPAMEYFISPDRKCEYYLSAIDHQSEDTDAIFNLTGQGKEMEFARSLPWKSKNCK
ncbi:MAG: hypothetical protein AB8G15_15625 [Saprospiraceae bacterium]